jgi:NAD-dependent DNA ligase
MSESESQTAQAQQFFEDIGVGSRPAKKLAQEFDTEDELVEFIVDGGELDEFSGVGEQSAFEVRTWFSAEYPEKEREMKERDEAYCTEYTLDHGLNEDQVADADGPVWAWICSRCDHNNPMEGDPDGFADRPYACVNCRWVPLLDSEALGEFAEEELEDEA